MTSEKAPESIAIGFPGQGPHEAEKMSRLIRQFPEAAELVQSAEDTLQRPLFELLLDPANAEHTSRENQVRLYLGSSALWRVASKEGLIPNGRKRYFFGASAGEFAALMAAGAYDFTTGLRLIDRRGEEMHKASIINPGEMLVASGLPFEEAEKLVENYPGVYAVNDNPGLQTVFSGARVTMTALYEHLSSDERWRKVSLHKPNILEAAHSWHMGPAKRGLKKVLRRSKVRPPEEDFMGNQAKLVKSRRQIKKHLTEQLTRGVLLANSANELVHTYNVRTFVDVGQGKVLHGQMRRQFKGEVELISIVDELLPEKK